MQLKSIINLRINRYVFIFISLFYITIFAINVSAQTYPFKHYTVQKGLISSETYHIFQDSKGYIWIATDDGISRYDGTTFKNYTKENGLPDNTVFEFYEDYQNRLWIIPYSLNLSYFINDTIIEYEHNDSIQKILKRNGNPVKLNFYVDSINRVFFRDKKKGSYLIDSKGNINPFRLNSFGVCLDVKKDKIIRANPVDNKVSEQKKWNYYNIFLNEDTILSKDLKPYIIDRNLVKGQIMGVRNKDEIFLARGRFIFRIKNSSIQTEKFQEDIIWLSIDNSNNLWVGTLSGAYCYNDLEIKNKPKILLEHKSVSSILNDSEGGYWFSTLYDGVYYLPNINIRTYTEKDGLLTNDIRSLAFDSTSLWMGFNTNYVQNFEQSEFKKKIELDKTNVVNYNLFYDTIYNKLWIGSQTLTSIESSIRNDFYFYENNKIYKNLHCKDFYMEKGGNIWFATFSGLYKHSNNTDERTLTKIGNFDQKINTLIKANKNFLLGCNNGLWEYNLDGKSFRFLGDKHKILTSKIVCSGKNTFHNNIWIGSSTNGIIVYDNDTIFNINTENGLSNNNITSMFLKKDVIWITTQNGLNKISLLDKSNKDSLRIETYSTTNGLPSNELNDIYIKDTIGYVATKEGLTVFNVNKLKTNNSVPPIYISKVGILGKDTVVKNSYKLPHNRNSLYIEFVGLTYKNLENKKYKYQILRQEQDPNWIETNENYVRLSFLPPGKYTFNVIALNENGVESLEPASINIIIKPPFWKTWWFIGMLIFGLIAIISMILLIIYFIKISEIKRRNELERKLLLEVNRFRQQALSQQMNPHFIFNTLNSIQYFIFDNDIDSSSQYLTKFSKLMRLVLDNSQNDIIPIEKELHAIELYLELESLRLDNQLQYEIKITDVDVKLYKIYPLLLQPYVENSIWHGLVHKKGEKKLKIEIVSNNDSFVCIIEDNGIGRKKAMEIKQKKNKSHKSHGTNITGKRIETINKLYNRNFKVDFIDLKDQDGNATGTKVFLKIPKIID